MINSFIDARLTHISWLGQITYSVLLDVCLIPQIPSTLCTFDQWPGLGRQPIFCPYFCTAAVWVSPIAFEIITFLMSLYKIWGHARASGDLKSNPLLRVLYLDSVRYFFVRPCFIQPAYIQSNVLSHPGYNGCVSTAIIATLLSW